MAGTQTCCSKLAPIASGGHLWLRSSQTGATAKACLSHWQLLCIEQATTATTEACHLTMTALPVPALVVLVYGMSMWLIHHELWLRDPGRLHLNPHCKHVQVNVHAAPTWAHAAEGTHTNADGGTNPRPRPACPIVLIACCKATRQADMRMDSIN